MSVPTLRSFAPVFVAACLVVSGCSISDDTDDNLIDTDAPLAGQEPGTVVEGEGGSNDIPAGGSEVPALPVDDPEQLAVPGEVEQPVMGPDAGPLLELPPAPVTGENAQQPVVDDGPALSPVSATGAGTADNQDDSPTQTESLSRNGPFIKDPARGAGPPSAPTGLTRLMAAEDWVEFSWAPSTDDQSVEAYEIYRDGVMIDTVRYDSDYEHDIRSWISTSFIDCNYTRYTRCEQPNVQPTPGGSYAYSVAAVDNEGMRSARSEEVVMSMTTPGQSTIDLAGYSQVFREEFSGTSLNRNLWKTSLPWGSETIINAETQYFVNTFGSDNTVTHDPFVFTGDTLQITGINTPPDQLGAANGQPYLSGVITTADYFEMTYGYVEMRAKLASGEGMLSTFYLFNQDYYKNKPEIDIIEYQGARPDKAYQTYHYYDSIRAREFKGEKHSSPTMETVTDQNLSNDFHTYGVLWEPERVVWYIDGVEVRRLEGVRVSDEPMNIVAQLVMGSSWIGEPDPAAVPAVVEIDYIRAWQK